MKVYSSNVEAPKYDYSVPGRWQEQDKEYEAAVKQDLFKAGWTGPNTGRIVSFGVADGYARYMYAENAQGKKAFLVHLDTGDGYSYPDVQYLPQREILKRLKGQDAVNEIFGRK